MDKDGIIGRPHRSDYAEGQLHQDLWADGQKVDHFEVQNPLGAFAVGGAIEAERRAAKGQ